MPNESSHLVVDTPAGLENRQVHDLIYDADNILIPVLPSPIDIRYAARFIADLMLVAQIERGNRKLAIIANRTRANTRSLKQLMRFLTSLRIPLVAILRDSQNYVRAADRGIGIYEMPHYKASRDIEDLSAIVEWLDRRQAPRIESTMMTPVQAMNFPTRPLH